MTGRRRGGWTGCGTLVADAGGWLSHDGRIASPVNRKDPKMTVNRIVRIVAGLFVLISLALGMASSPFYVSSNWLWFTAFVGANLLQSGFTRFCPLDIVLKKAGVKEA
mgnify:CR=1 FL=1